MITPAPFAAGNFHCLSALRMQPSTALDLIVDDLVFALVTDPSRRSEKPPTETPDPNAAARKARPTEEEKRLIERRKPASPPLPPEPVPAPPPK